MATIGGPRKRRVRYRTWLEKIWSFLNSALGTTLLVTVIGGYVIRGAVIRLESAQREGELAVAAAEAPVEHRCRPAAAGARQALIKLGGALTASKRRMINDLDDR